MKRFVSILLLLALVLTVFPAGAMAPAYENMEQWYSDEEDMYLNPGDHSRLQFSLEPIEEEAAAVDAITRAAGGHGGGVGPIVPPLPEPTPEMKAMYNYVSSLKTYLNECKDSSITINGMDRNAVVFNLDCFGNKEDAEVVIKVAGYEDLVLNHTGRKVEPEVKPESEVPRGDQEAPVGSACGAQNRL